MNLQQAAEFTLKFAMDQGIDQADVIAGRSESASMLVFDRKVQNSELSISQGVGIRLFSKQKPGYSFSERLSEDSLRQAVLDALDQTHLTQNLELDLPEPSPALIGDWASYDYENENLSLEAMSQKCLALEERALSGHSSVVNVPHLGAERTKSTSILLNSKGFSEIEKSTHWGIGLGVVSALDEIKKMGVASFSSHFLTEIQWDQTADLAVERSLELLSAKPIPSGNYPMMLSKRVAGQFLSMFSSIFSADQVQKGLSRLQDRIGDQVASNCFNLKSDPLRKDLPGARRWDSEGVPAQTVPLIVDGQLRDFLYNLETAHKAGRISNACAQRSYSGRVGVGFSNLIVEKGASSQVELASQFPRFLEVVKLEGGTGCSAVSGQISIGVQGFLWEAGERVQAVDRITISGDFFEWLHKIVAVGDQYDPFWTSAKSPDLWFESVIVAS